MSDEDAAAPGGRGRPASPSHIPVPARSTTGAARAPGRPPRAATPEVDDPPGSVGAPSAALAGVLSPQDSLISMSSVAVTGCTAAVVGHEVTRDSKDGAAFAVFLVEARLQDEPYVVKRRFTKFVELRKQLVRMFPKSAIPPLDAGPTTFGRNLDPEYLAQRTRALDSFLQALLDVEEVQASPPLLQFMFNDSGAAATIDPSRTAVGILLDPVEVTSASISAGGNLVYDKLLLDPTAVLIWDSRTAEHDIAFSVEFVGVGTGASKPAVAPPGLSFRSATPTRRRTEEGQVEGARQVVRAYARYNSHVDTVQGSFSPSSFGLGSGTAFLVWDNSYSMLRGKELAYRVRVVTSADAASAAAEERQHRTRLSQLRAVTDIASHMTVLSSDSSTPRRECVSPVAYYNATTSEGNMAELLDRLREMEALVDTERRLRASAELKCDVATGKAEEAERGRAAAEARMTAMQDSYAAALVEAASANSLAANAQAVLEAREALELRVGRLTDELLSASSRISELDAACRAKDSRILELEVGLAGAEAAIAAHANQVAALEGAIAKLKAEKRVLVKEIKARRASTLPGEAPLLPAALAEEGGGRSRGESDFSDAPGLATEAKGAGERRSVSAARMGGASAAADGVRAASARRPSASPEGLRNLAPRISEGEEGDEKDAFWLQVRPWEHSSRPVSAQKERASSPLPPG